MRQAKVWEMKDVLQERNVASGTPSDGRRRVEDFPGDTDEMRGDGYAAHFFVNLTPQFSGFIVLYPPMRIQVPVGSCVVGYDAVFEGSEQVESPLGFPVKDGLANGGLPRHPHSR